MPIILTPEDPVRAEAEKRQRQKEAALAKPL